MPYIDDDLLFAYCMGWLSKDEQHALLAACKRRPDIKRALEEMEQSLWQFAKETANPLPAGLEDQIWNKLENINLEQKADIHNLPEINEFTDYRNWVRIVAPLIPKNIDEDIYMIPLRELSHITQTLVISKVDFPEESHDDIYERLLLLQGSCRFTIEGETRPLNMGDYIAVPLYMKHHVTLSSPYVVGILQHTSV